MLSTITIYVSVSDPDPDPDPDPHQNEVDPKHCLCIDFKHSIIMIIIWFESKNVDDRSFEDFKMDHKIV